MSVPLCYHLRNSLLKYCLMQMEKGYEKIQISQFELRKVSKNTKLCVLQSAGTELEIFGIHGNLENTISHKECQF